MRLRRQSGICLFAKLVGSQGPFPSDYDPFFGCRILSQFRHLAFLTEMHHVTVEAQNATDHE